MNNVISYRDVYLLDEVSSVLSILGINVATLDNSDVKWMDS